VNGEELKQFVPELLEARYPGRSREAAPGPTSASLQYPAQWIKAIRDKFGGQAFSAEDWVLMSF
jgi:hypothetical protein